VVAIGVRHALRHNRLAALGMPVSRVYRSAPALGRGSRP
jgi:hypothetical protein